MDNISTIIILRELDKRIHMYKQGDIDSFLSLICDIDEESVVQLDKALESVLHSYAEYQVNNVVKNLEEFANG